MKKIVLLFFSLILAAGLSACGNGSGQSETGQNSQKETGAVSEDAAEPSEALSEGSGDQSSETEAAGESAGGNTLVVYYSATNNTETVAGYIADAAGADLFELVPVKPYTSDDLDWTDRDSRVSVEHDDPDQREVELENAVPENWEDYDTVFIGYPIWWGIAAWPVNGFISANDFTGKTVIPFCTSSSSGLGESGELLQEAAGTGNWLEGERFQSRASKETVQEWVDSLGF